MGNSSSSGHRARDQPESLKDDIPATKLLLPIDYVLKNKNSSKPILTGLQVDVPSSGGYRDCYLDTSSLSMCYLAPQQPWDYGNVSLNWILRQDDDEAYHLSNYVTDEANEKPRKGTSKTYLDTGNQIASGGYSLIVVGDGVKLYLEYDNGKSTNFALYIKIKDDKYYLQPVDPTTGENTIIAKTEVPQNGYNFAFTKAQPIPSVTK